MKSGVSGVPLTTHILHRDLELLPIPLVLAIVHLHHDLVNFVEPRLGFGSQTALSDEVPKVFRDFTLKAFGFDIVQPSVNDGVFLSDTLESGWTGVLPLSHGSLEVERFPHDSVSDSGHVCWVERRWQMGGKVIRGGGSLKTCRVEERATFQTLLRGCV